MPGEEAVINVNIARLPSHSDINLKITVARAVEDGPTLLLSGGLHGDEINGVEIVSCTYFPSLYEKDNWAANAI